MCATFTIKVTYGWWVTHPACVFSPHDSIPFSIDNAFRLFIFGLKYLKKELTPSNQTVERAVIFEIIQTPKLDHTNTPIIAIPWTILKARLST